MRHSTTVAVIASVTIALTAAVAYTDVRCGCGKKVAAVPGKVQAVALPVTEANRSGRGPVISCKNCGLVEVIVHGGR